jgi:hypothetical protein
VKNEKLKSKFKSQKAKLQFKIYNLKFPALALALVVQRIGRKIADLAIEVRFLTGAEAMAGKELTKERLKAVFLFFYFVV